MHPVQYQCIIDNASSSASKWGKNASDLRGLTNREPFERLRSAEKLNQMSSLNRVPAVTMRR